MNTMHRTVAATTLALLSACTTVHYSPDALKQPKTSVNQNQTHHPPTGNAEDTIRKIAAVPFKLAGGLALLGGVVLMKLSDQGVRHYDEVEHDNDIELFVSGVGLSLGGAALIGIGEFIDPH